MMPSMDAWQLRVRLRTDPVLAAIPIVIMTAHAGVLRAVANARPETPVLSKPLHAARLLQMVATPACGAEIAVDFAGRDERREVCLAGPVNLEV